MFYLNMISSGDEGMLLTNDYTQLHVIASLLRPT
jgi:hypothetical protein